MKISNDQGELTHLLFFGHVDINNKIRWTIRFIASFIVLLFVFMKEPQYNSKIKTQQKIFCCYDVDINKDEEPKRVNNTFLRMPMLVRGVSSTIKFKNIKHNNRQPIYQLLNDLYEKSNASDIYSLLRNRRINPVLHNNQERDDLEYYIPQIVTFLVLEKNIDDEELINLILGGCSTHFYFAHRVYFYLKSLSEDKMGSNIPSVCQFLDQKFIVHMNMYKHAKLSGIELTKSMLQMDPDMKGKIPGNAFDHASHKGMIEQIREEELMWERYGTKLYPDIIPLHPKPIPKVIRKSYCEHGFMETPMFWDDLLEIGNQVVKVPNDERGRKLEYCIKEVNEKLPANVYIPFFKEEIRLYTILCVWKGRLFSTKQRAPYSIWVEIYREEEELNLQKVVELDEEDEIIEQTPQKRRNKKNILEKIYDTISRPFSISSEKNTLNIKKFLTEKFSLNEQHIDKKKSLKKSRNKRSGVTHSFAEQSNRYSIAQIYEERQREKQTRSEGRDSIDNRSFSSSLSSLQEEPEQRQNLQQKMMEFFGPKSSDYIQDVRERSIYRNMKSWKLVHLMVKTGDDIKQQQFAMQLINRFQYAFTKQKVDCVVFPYQVISLGPDCGVIEMLNDITTLSSLFEKLYLKKMTLRQFFDRVYPNPAQARRNFMRSLAGYSILTYFLQVKDRHNGNILLSRDGYIIHIDFGFFLSNAPGKGVELQKKVPFKLLTQYVEVIGQLSSHEFFQFRQLFYKGFRAVLKEKDAILTLVKMMYSSHMESMGCFTKGQIAIEELQQRFSIEQRVEDFCYTLINNSLDNWRVRWYDKFQYFLQKIYY